MQATLAGILTAIGSAVPMPAVARHANIKMLIAETTGPPYPYDFNDQNTRPQKSAGHQGQSDIFSAKPLPGCCFRARK